MLDPKVKKVILEAAEETTKTSLNQLINVLKALAASTDAAWDDAAVVMLENLKVLMLDGLVEQINPDD